MRSLSRLLNQLEEARQYLLDEKNVDGYVTVTQFQRSLYKTLGNARVSIPHWLFNPELAPPICPQCGRKLRRPIGVTKLKGMAYWGWTRDVKRYCPKCGYWRNFVYD